MLKKKIGYALLIRSSMISVSYTHLLSDRIVKDDVITFEQLGVDKLFIDEADMFKNLGLSTNCLLYTSRCV